MKSLDKKTTLFLLITGLIFIFFGGIIAEISLMKLFGLLGVWILFLAFLYNPLNGLLAILFLRPLADKFSSLEFGIPFNENVAIKLSAFLGIFVIFLTIIYIIRNHSHFWKVPLFKSWTILLLILFSSIFYSLNYFLSFYEFLRVASIGAIFFLFYNFSKNKTNRKKIVKFTLIISIVPIVVAIFQLLTHTGLGGTSGIESRLYGTFAHPNSFASFLIIILALSFWKIISNAKNKQTSPYWILFLTTLFLILETFSRGAWLAILVFFLFYGIIKSPKIILGIGLMGIVLFFAMPTFHDRIENVYNPPADSSIVWRFQKWQRVLVVIKKHPWLGTGAGTEVPIHEKEYGFYAGNPYTHNDFLKLFLENGLLGLTSFLLLIIWTIFSLLKRYFGTKNTKDKMFVLIILLLFIAELIFSMSSNIWRGTTTMWILWALIAIALRLKTKKTIRSQSH